LPTFFRKLRRRAKPRIEFASSRISSTIFKANYFAKEKLLMRICSLLPSATEILYALGLGDSVVGVTHECDFPPEAAEKPALIRPRVDPHAAAGEIDRQVSELVARGESIYAVDAELLRSLEPDLIVTQDLCHVCAASPDDLAMALTQLPNNPRVLTLTPHSLRDVWNDIRKTGDVTQRRREAQALAITLEQKVAAIEAKAAHLKTRPRVLCLEWLDPFYVGGHWVPEMVAKAGGEDVLGRAGEPSFRVSGEQIAASEAEIVVVMPCGYSVKRTMVEYSTANFPHGYMNLPAVRAGRVFAMDANSYFSRPGPRLGDGVALLAHLFHPHLFPTAPSGSSLQQL
jgi:iron complex transport system substrate-binding protein